jgi:hypothetical protein
MRVDRTAAHRAHWGREQSTVHIVHGDGVDEKNESHAQRAPGRQERFAKWRSLNT